MAELGAIGNSAFASFACVLDVAAAWDVSMNPVHATLPAGVAQTSRREGWAVISGVISDQNGEPCARKVLVLQRGGVASGRLLGSGMSDAATGAYAVRVDYHREVFRIVLDSDDAPFLNDLIDRVQLA